MTQEATRTILHLDLDAFFCTVEEQRDPSLRGQAFAVGGLPQDRGVVASCSYPARAHGVRSAMSMAAALRLCPNLLIVPSRHSEYRAVSRRVMALLSDWTPLIEQISIDEAFLDVTELVNNPNAGVDGRILALELQERIVHELGLSSSLGVASNKMVAKIATDFGKASSQTGQSPQAICVVLPGEEAQFLAPLPVGALWGVGPKMRARLELLGINTIGQLAQWPQRDLLRRFGRHGYELSQHARGIDNRKIVTSRESKSISSETTFSRDVQDWDVLHSTLTEQATHIAAQLQKQKLNGTTIKVKLRWSDFSTVTRQLTLPQPTTQAEIIGATATALLLHLWQGEQPVRLLGVGIGGLSPIQQLSLFDGETPETPTIETSVQSNAFEIAADEPPKTRRPKREKLRQLQEAIALLEARYGAPVVQAGLKTRDG